MATGMLAALALYVAVLGAVTWLAYRWAAKRGLAPWKRGLAAIVGFLVVFLPGFGDHFATLFAYKQYCETEAGFWIYQPLEKWKAENPGVLETLVSQGEGKPEHGTYALNERFSLDVMITGPEWRHRWERNHELLDRKSGAVMARYIDHTTGSRIGGEPPLRSWLQRDRCEGGEANYAKFLEFKRAIQGKPRGG